MEREKILEMYLNEVQAELADETPSLLFIRGLTKFCNTMLDEEERCRAEAVLALRSAVGLSPIMPEEPEPKEPPTVDDDTDRGRGRRHWLSDSEVQRIKNLRDTGKSIAEIVRITGFSRATVCRKLSGYLPKKNGKPGKGHIDWFRDLAAEGMGVKAISDRTGYTEEIVRKYIGGNADGE